MATLPDEFSATVPAGSVARQDPLPNTALDRGASVSIALSKGPDLVTIPTLAGRDLAAMQKALTDAGRPRLDAVAATQGPGLVGSLLVGLSFAKSYAWSIGVPLVPVHHLAGHIESLVLAEGELPLPAVVLVVSGGHTSLYRVTAPGVYERLGRTRDDAAGEAYDKVAKLLSLGYPGGPIIDSLARERGLEMVVNQETTVVWAPAAQDLTDLVLKRLAATAPATAPTSGAPARPSTNQVRPSQKPMPRPS